MTLPRIAVFVADLSDRPGRGEAVEIANRLQAAGHPVDLIAPTGGGPLRVLLSPAVGQIDLARRHAATSVLPLARIVAERRPAVLASPAAVAWVARLALGLARTGGRFVATDAGGDAVAAIRDAARRSG